jgi:Ca2+-binding EF-hand superfamily protein
MLLALGALSSAVDALQSLTSKKSTSSQGGFGQIAATPLDTANPGSGSGGCSPGGGLSPATMSALLAAQGQSPGAPASRSDALKDLFSQLDANGDGQVSKSEFENALGAGGSNIAQADDVFSKLDKNGDGSVSLDEMSSALKGAGHGHRHHHHVAGSEGSDSDPLLQALDGASSTAVTNSDGSTTTSLTYANGSKVTMTSAPTASASTSAASSYNVIEQMIQREAQAISASAASSLSVTA